jgi:ribonuclease P protein subunit POP4
MITPENLPIHELIGLRVRVAKSLSAPHKGLSGTVVDETKNTLVLSDGGREIVVPKKGCTFAFSLPGKKRAVVEGSTIAFRPYDRPKKIRMK